MYNSRIHICDLRHTMFRYKLRPTAGTYLNQALWLPRNTGQGAKPRIYPKDVEGFCSCLPQYQTGPNIKYPSQESVPLPSYQHSNVLHAFVLCIGCHVSNVQLKAQLLETRGSASISAWYPSIHLALQTHLTALHRHPAARTELLFIFVLAGLKPTLSTPSWTPVTSASTPWSHRLPGYQPSWPYQVADWDVIEKHSLWRAGGEKKGWEVTPRNINISPVFPAARWSRVWSWITVPVAPAHLLLPKAPLLKQPCCQPQEPASAREVTLQLFPKWEFIWCWEERVLFVMQFGKVQIDYKAPPAKQPSTNKALGNTIRIVSKDLQSHLKFAWVIQTLLKNTAYYFHSNLGHSSRKVWVQGAHAQTALLQSAPPQVCRQLMCLTTWELNNLYNMPWNSSKASTLPNWSIKLGPGCPKHLYWS